jgi:hypothetical protein
MRNRPPANWITIAIVLRLLIVDWDSMKPAVPVTTINPIRKANIPISDSN